MHNAHLYKIFVAKSEHRLWNTFLELSPKEPSIKIVFDNKYGIGATCHAVNASSTSTQLPSFTNHHANNPAEARLTTDCFIKASAYFSSLISNQLQ